MSSCCTKVVVARHFTISLVFGRNSHVVPVVWWPNHFKASHKWTKLAEVDKRSFFVSPHSLQVKEYFFPNPLRQIRKQAPQNSKYCSMQTLRSLNNRHRRNNKVGWWLAKKLGKSGEIMRPRQISRVINWS